MYCLGRHIIGSDVCPFTQPFDMLSCKVNFISLSLWDGRWYWMSWQCKCDGSIVMAVMTSSSSHWTSLWCNGPCSQSNVNCTHYSLRDENCMITGHVDSDVNNMTVTYRNSHNCAHSIHFYAAEHTFFTLVAGPFSSCSYDFPEVLWPAWLLYMRPVC